MKRVQPTSFDFNQFDDWFKAETATQFISFIVALANILEEVDKEIDGLIDLDLGESMVDRMTRDIKAKAYENIEASIGDILFNANF